MIDEKKLKECPFCGGKAEIKEFSNGHKGNGEFTANYKVGCQKCNIYFQFQSMFVLDKGQPKFIQNGYEKCIETWNRRADNNYMQTENRKQVE